MPTLQQLVDMVGNGLLRLELKELTETAAAFERAQHVHTGDRAVIAERFDLGVGWLPYREILTLPAELRNEAPEGQE